MEENDFKRIEQLVSSVVDARLGRFEGEVAAKFEQFDAKIDAKLGQFEGKIDSKLGQLRKDVNEDFQHHVAQAPARG